MINNRIKALRGIMKKQNLDAFIITGTDPHQSESVAERWQTRAFISGFTGSAGTVVITHENAGLWTDSRYFLQAENELAETEITLFRMGMPDVPEYGAWLAKELSAKKSVGVCGWEISFKRFNELSKKLGRSSIGLQSTQDLLDQIWDDRPSRPGKPIYPLNEQF